MSEADLLSTQGVGGEPTPPARDWKANLPEDIRNDTSLAPIKDIEGLAKSYVNAQKLIGRDKIPMPKDENDPVWNHNNGSDSYSGNAYTEDFNNMQVYILPDVLVGDVVKVETLTGAGETEDGKTPAADAIALRTSWRFSGARPSRCSNAGLTRFS